MINYDLSIGNGGTVRAFNTGFFESAHGIQGGNATTEYIEFGVYRVVKTEYEAKKEIFDKFLRRNHAI